MNNQRKFSLNLNQLIDTPNLGPLQQSIPPRFDELDQFDCPNFNLDQFNHPYNFGFDGFNFQSHFTNSNYTKFQNFPMTPNQNSNIMNLGKMEDELILDNRPANIQYNLFQPVIHQTHNYGSITINNVQNMQNIQEFSTFDFIKNPKPPKDTQNKQIKYCKKNKITTNMKKQRLRIVKNKRGNNLQQDKKEYDKNICRYISRQIIRSFVNSEFRQPILSYCNNDQDLYNDVTQHYINKIELISGHRALREQLLGDPQQDSKVEIQYKMIFSQFCYWYLKNRAIRFIMYGNMDNKHSYLQYKNDIMLYYVRRPKSWNKNSK